MRHVLKVLVASVLCSQASWACGVGYGPELGLIVLGVLAVAGIPAIVAPLIGMVLARKRNHNFTIGAALSVPAGWICSLGATMILGVPGYFLGLIASLAVSRLIASRYLVPKPGEPADPGFTPAAGL